MFGTTPTANTADVVEPAAIEAMESRWTNFARTGVPSPDWPRFNRQTQTVGVFSNDGFKAEQDYEKARMELVAGLPASVR